MPAGKVDVVITANGVQYTRTMQAAANAAKQFGSANAQAGASTTHLVSRTQAASATIRVFEGNLTNSVRAAENFLSRIPGVGAALQAAFPVIGAIALAGVIGELTKKVYTFVHTATQVPEKLQEAFQATSEGFRSSNDALQMSIDKVRNEIAILQDRPPNLMAEALDRSRLEADKLAESLRKAADEFKKLMKEQKIGAFAGLVTHQAKTVGTAGSIESYQKQQVDIADQLADAKDSGSPQQIAALQKQLDDSRASEKAWLTNDLAQEKAKNDPGSWWHRVNWGTENTAGNQNIDNAALRELGSQQLDESRTNTLDSANDQKDAIEAQKKADAERLKTMQEGLAMEKAQYGMSIAAELAYWTARIGAFSKGSDQYRTVLMQTYTLQADLYKQDLAVKKSYQEKQDSDQKESEAVLVSSSNAVRKEMVQQANDVLRTGAAWKGYHDAVTQAAESQVKMSSALAEASIHMAEMSGRMTKHNAAQALAALHASDYADAMSSLKSQQTQIAGDGSLTESAKATGLQQNANKQAELAGQYQIQQQSDKNAVSDTTLGGATRNALDEMVNAWTDMAHIIPNLMVSGLETINSQLAQSILQSGTPLQRRKSWGKAFDGLANQGVSAGLHGVEGYALKGLGLGPKTLGTRGNPMYTISADAKAVGGAIGTGVDSIAHSFPGIGKWVQGIFGGGSSSSSSGASSDAALISSVMSGAGQEDTVSGPGGSTGRSTASRAGGFVSSLLHVFQGAFAGGGDVVANRPALVGERGPELFIPHSAGRIQPNGSFGGDTHYHVDARGSTDPAATEAAIHRAMNSSYTRSVQGSAQAMQEMRKRTPRSAQ